MFIVVLFIIVKKKKINNWIGQERYLRAKQWNIRKD